MTFKLFHVTEFAESVLLSPKTQRESTHPVTLVVLICSWLVGICNYPLWRTLASLPLASGRLWWLGACLALLMIGTFLVLMSLLCWRHTLKPALLLLLLLATLNLPLMQAQAGFIDLQADLAHTGTQLRHAFGWAQTGLSLLLFLLPGVWLWRLPVRRLSWRANLRVNALLLAVAGALLAGTWWLGGGDVAALLRDQPQLRQQLNPFVSLQTLASSAAAGLLPR
jgi:lipid A ethanolaminephosphotransferase